MSYFKNYLDELKQNQKLVQSIQKTTLDFMDKLAEIDVMKPVTNTLLLGNVQSGKTGQALGIISALADKEYKFFIYLTTDSIDLQKQTLDRVKQNLPLFSVLSENDMHHFNDIFRENKPVIAVIKKNSRVLEKWRNHLSSQKYLKGYPLVIVDDEADAASLNTQVNEYKVSRINQLLDDIKKSCSKTLFIELTATPQAIILQNQKSDWQPEFVQYFEAGEEYIGGNFVFTEPESFIVRFINEELKEVRDESISIAEGLAKAVITYLVTCAEFALTNRQPCNFAIHPSIRVADHNAFKEKLTEYLNQMIFALNQNEDETLRDEFYRAWEDLRSTKPDIKHFDDIYEKICELLEKQVIKILVLNSKTNSDPNLNLGFNIVIGGNVIGRGLTIPALQTVYYSRISKKPNADTFWQHSRIFGYDREKALMRLFIPQDIYKFFVELNQANNLLIEQAKNSNQGIQIIYPPNIQPTRKNVLDSNSLCLIAGGSNYFPNNPDQTNLVSIQKLVVRIRNDNLPIQDGIYEVDSLEIIEILENLGKFDEWDWNVEKFISCVHSLKGKRPNLKSYVLIRENRDIGKGTGTMLSPDDRQLGKKFDDALLLTLYQVKGQKEKNWEGIPFWLPNIKFPRNLVFWDIDD
ncbi:Z1 domain-containing protein [Avibacterium avium]|uniref:Z1 domain n=1 Tax=Avibacterium avium TaxID=751 RepID=A0A379APZ1_AVIAV|nr:Z1 domain-containing protein [Avibacterium avium]SUB23766.1 Z1 domain [Avibacterium avium]